MTGLRDALRRNVNTPGQLLYRTRLCQVLAVV